MKVFLSAGSNAGCGGPVGGGAPMGLIFYIATFNTSSSVLRVSSVQEAGYI